MANISKLDTKQKLQFLRAFIPKNEGMTLTETNEEIRKKFGRGMDLSTISDERKKAKHTKKMKSGTTTLRPKNHDALLRSPFPAQRLAAMAVDFADAMKMTKLKMVEFVRNDDGSVTFTTEIDVVETVRSEQKI